VSPLRRISHCIVGLVSDQDDYVPLHAKLLARMGLPKVRERVLTYSLGMQQMQRCNRARGAP